MILLTVALTILGEERDFEGVWRTHLNDSVGRQEYAQSMYKLATHYWEGGAENCRVKWCHDMLRKYYMQTVNQWIEKDLRVACCELDALDSTEESTEYISMKTRNDMSTSIQEHRESTNLNPDNISVHEPASQPNYTRGFVRKIGASSPNFVDMVPTDPSQRMRIKRVREQFKTVATDRQCLEALRKEGAKLLFGSNFSEPDFEHRKRLLDVGSCYNPFSKLKDENLNVIAIDLTPACEVCINICLYSEFIVWIVNSRPHLLSRLL